MVDDVLEIQSFNRDKTSAVKIHGQSPMRSMGVEPKTRLIIRPETKHSQEARLIKKDLSEQIQSDIPAEEYYRIWKTLKEAGIPVVSTVKKVSDNEVVMTDLTADGSQLYGKNRYLQNTLTQLDQLFLKLDFEEVERQARIILQRANNAKIFLAADDPLELVLHPDGSFDLIALDISTTIIPSHELYESKLKKTSIEEMNKRAIEGVFLNALEKIKLQILDPHH